MAGRNFAWVLIGGLALTACGDDSGGGTGGGGGGDAATGTTESSGTGNPDGFSLNDVAISLVDAVPGTGREIVDLTVNYENCPVGENCDDIEITLNGLVLGRWADVFPPLPDAPTYDRTAVRAALVPGQDAVLTLTIGSHTSTLTMPCPGSFDIISPDSTDVVTTPGPLNVAWSPFSNVAADSGSGLAPNNSSVAAYEWDQELNQPGPNAVLQVAADATSATLDLTAFGELADAGIVSVQAAGPIVETAQGGEGACNFERQVEFAIP